MKKNATERRRERIKGNKRGERRERKKGRERESRKTKEERTEKEGVQREKRGIRKNIPTRNRQFGANSGPCCMLSRLRGVSALVTLCTSQNFASKPT